VTSSFLDLFQQIQELRDVPVASYELAESAFAYSSNGRPSPNCREDCIWSDGLGLSLDSDWLETIDRDVILDQAVRSFADQNRCGISMLLQAGSQIRGITDSSVVRPKIVTDGTHNDRSGIDPDPNAKLGSTRTELLLPLSHGPLNT
jgi:hypothetical protein